MRDTTCQEGSQRGIHMNNIRGSPTRYSHSHPNLIAFDRSFKRVIKSGFQILYIEKSIKTVKSYQFYIESFINFMGLEHFTYHLELEKIA